MIFTDSISKAGVAHVVVLAMVLLFPASVRAGSATPAVPPTISFDAWKSTLPFSFKYDGKDSSQFLSTWHQAQETVPSEGGQLHRYTFSDPATDLKVVAEVRTFTGYDALDWVLTFTNESNADTPIIENIEPLNWTITPPAGNCIVHHARGSDAKPTDFEPLTEPLASGGTVTLASKNGRSSDTNTLPFFNLQMGDRGLIGAVAWTGNWSATFDYTKPKALTMTAGMQKTHFLLHPGETVRTPRIVLLNYHGDVDDSQNLWRRMVLAYYSPRDQQGKTVVPPLCVGTWGTELISAKLDFIKQYQDKKIPAEVYWVDAGWYGNETPKPGTTIDSNSPWWRQRGNWWPNPQTYPDGLAPLGQAVHDAKMRFLLWIEPEEADPDTDLRKQHSDWFFLPPTCDNPGTALVNLGNTEARQGITDLVSKIIGDAGIDWYRQDFNVRPQPSWDGADTADRIGISEINYITGLYRFLDDLRSQHPGLQIDNCASGGRRLDLEMMSRSVSLWRTDNECAPFDPAVGQAQTQGLNPWVPLNAGCYGGVASGTPGDGASLLYAVRSNYSSGFDFNPGPLDNLKEIDEEYLEVRPYFVGDFYPLKDYSTDTSSWAVWQFDRPDLKAGMALVFRRQGSALSSVQPELKAIDPQAQYEVEIRMGLDKGPSNKMSGKDLTNLQVSIPDEPGSALLFYKRL
jgi:alpha-galactosidase